MNPTQVLPDGYEMAGKIDMHDRRTLVSISLASIFLLPPSGWLFFQILHWLRPEEISKGFEIHIEGFIGVLLFIGYILVAYIAMIVFHEAIHGIFFWIYTHTRPTFALRLNYAYAAAPAWYLPRNQYLLTCLAPLLFISLFGIGLMTIAPPSWFLLLVFILLANASGAAGDLYVAAWLLKHPAACLANDQGDVFTLYQPLE